MRGLIEYATFDYQIVMLIHRFIFFFAFVCSFGFVLAEAEETAAGDEFSREQIEFFENRIRPLLADRCFDCHTGTKAKVGLQLDHRAGWLKGSDYRSVVNLEKPEESVLIQAVRHVAAKEVPQMPEKGAKLSEEEVNGLLTWMEMGLPWPKEIGEEITRGDPKDHWSFQAVKATELPEGAGHPIDYFLSKSQEAAGIKRAPRADRYTRYRRLHYDLLGLPPKYEEVQKFVNDGSAEEKAWPTLVDRLLESPHYGEKWARHWMDVARYSDTKGYEAGGRERRFVYSYTYRDWLIRAFNEDMPFDQFVKYQLAAEQMVDWKGPDKKHLAALGYITLSKNGRSELVIDDRVDTTFRGLMSLTVACARCHDHKFDPIPTKEYYGLAGVFLNSMTEEQPVIGEPKEGPEYEKYLKDLAKEQKVVDDFLEPKLKKIAEENPNIANRRIQLIAKLERVDRRELSNLQRVVDKFVADRGMEPDKALIVKDREPPVNAHVLIRGNPSRRGELAPRQFLAIASQGEPVVFEKGSGRLELADAIASPDNPLTARAIVNRVWMWHFGEGIVRTIDDFGIQGEAPDHPELLDWLANWFVENGWSIKKLHRLILTSETWQQQATHPDAEGNMLVDSENRLLWRFDRRRLSLEQMRDSMLEVSGSLSDQMFGRTVKILEPPYSNRRSVYAFIDRQNLNPVFRNFDFSNPQETTGKRPKTTIPMQALFTMNSKFVQDQAAKLARSTEKADDRLAALHHAAFARNPEESDRQLADSFISSFESEAAKLGKRQTSTEWSYGYGDINDETGAVSFTPLPFWTGERWQMEKEWPLKDNPLSYLFADEGNTHSGYTRKESAIYQWRSPDDLRIKIKSVVKRPNVNKGNGVRIKVAKSSGGLVFDQVMDPKLETMDVSISELQVKKGEFVYFLVDPHENNSSFDSVTWSPQIVDLEGNWAMWGLAESFSGPATPATAWDAYSHALLNTNRFLFIE